MNSKVSGNLSPGNIRRIAKSYSINRGIVAADRNSNGEVNSDNHARWLADEINDFDCEKHKSLREKAEWCERKASEAKDRGHTHYVFGSGITRLLWFRCQANWTVYDKHASSAVGAKGQNTLDKMKDYYNKLDCRGFLEYEKEINELLMGSDFEILHGSRVIDAYLLLNSTHKTWPRDLIEESYWFLESLPESIKGNIVRTGKKMIPVEIKSLLREK